MTALRIRSSSSLYTSSSINRPERQFQIGSYSSGYVSVFTCLHGVVETDMLSFRPSRPGLCAWRINWLRVPTPYEILRAEGLH